MPALTVVIPAFNEASRIIGTLHRLCEYFAASNTDAEIVVVDDGSSDGTAGIVSAFGGSTVVRVIALPANRGKGYAVRQGVREALGAHVLISDADLSTPIDQLELLQRALGDGVDVAIASRGLSRSDIVVRQPWWREGMGRIFNVCARVLRLTRFHDTQCGFKLFRGEDAKRLCRLLVIDGFAYDVELLFAAAQNGLHVKEIPVSWRHAELSRVNPWRAPAAMIGDLLRIRARAWAGRYTPATSGK